MRVGEAEHIREATHTIEAVNADNQMDAVVTSQVTVVTRPEVRFC